MRSVSTHEHFAGIKALLAEHRAQEARLAGAVSAENSDEFTGTHVEVEPTPEHAFAKDERPAPDAQHRCGVTRNALWRHAGVNAWATASMLARIHET